MFTGIIEEIGTVRTITRRGESLAMAIQASAILEDVRLGDSIAVNGVCLTVTTFTRDSFTVDVMPETFNNTSLALLKPGGKINLERAMAANGRFGGHFVAGHVDGVGKIVSITPKDNAVYYNISVPKEGLPFLTAKGAISVDGTSLTIFGIEGTTVTISLIPHTRQETVLGMKSVGDVVNLEFDMLAKYLHSFLARKEQANNITPDFLKEHGFM